MLYAPVASKKHVRDICAVLAATLPWFHRRFPLEANVTLPALVPKPSPVRTPTLMCDTRQLKQGLTCYSKTAWSFLFSEHSLPSSGTSKSFSIFIEGNLDVKLPTIWTDEKQRWEESEKRREEERRSNKRKSQKKEDPGARKGRKVAWRYVFPMVCGSGGSNSRLARAAGAEPAGQMRDEKLHGFVARSTFPSQNVQGTPCSDHFWKLWCRKSARRYGAKHISKSKVKSVKNWRVRTTFGGSDVLTRGRRKGLWTLSKMSKTWGFCRIS